MPPAVAKPVEDSTLTPMMAQYVAVKKQHPDCVVLFRLGDFYEIFFEDAAPVASALGIQLTRRNKQNDDDIPMCGIPWHQLDNYLPQLINKGFRVALCEQLEDPAEAKKRGGKVLVERGVVRIVTPGTLYEDTLLDAASNNFLAAVAMVQQQLAVAWLDMSTGTFQVQAVAMADMPALLARIHPSELLIPEYLRQMPALFEVWQAWKASLTVLPDAPFHPMAAQQRLLHLYKADSLDSFGTFSQCDVAAAGAVVHYLELTQKGNLPKVNRLTQLKAEQFLHLDAATRRNLELFNTQTGERKGSLLATIDHTITSAGGRLLRQWLAAPLLDADLINARLDAVTAWMGCTVQDAFTAMLQRLPDIQRALSRISLQKASPRDLAAIYQGLDLAEQLASALRQLPIPPLLLQQVADALPICLSLTSDLENALADDLPMLARDGGFIRQGYNPRLDEIKTLQQEGQRLIAGLEQRYKNDSGVSGLKIKYNNVLGYFIEVPPRNADGLPEQFIHRQTLANAARFTTVELNDLQSRILRADSEALGLELEIFQQLCTSVLHNSDILQRAAEALAILDVTLALAVLAADENYCRPLVDHSQAFAIVDGRHPVVAAALQQRHATPFVGNDCSLANDQKIWLLTGPNMAGKSTFLRQNALIAILAQMGSYVPARQAHIGLVDAVYSRVGAADDLAQGRSTFMVEMVETAAILNQATDRSLVILDEIGRGTATYDGLSIAWATLEYLHAVNQCRTLFATHYHELNVLEDKLSGLTCYTMRVEETSDGVVFLHKVGKGRAGRSFGIYVAQLAGMPEAVLHRAEELLQRLEKDAHQHGLGDLPLFRPQHFVRTAPVASPIEQALKGLDLSSLSPKQALDQLYLWQQQVAG